MPEGESPPDNNVFRGFISALYNTVDTPVTWFRGKIRVYINWFVM